jgi:hypothetical protein
MKTGERDTIAAHLKKCGVSRRSLLQLCSTLIMTAPVGLSLTGRATAAQRAKIVGKARRPTWRVISDSGGSTSVGRAISNMGTSAKTKPQRLQAPTNSRILWQNESQLTPSPELKATPQKRCVKSHASRGSRPRRIFSLPRHMVHEAHALLTALCSTSTSASAHLPPRARWPWRAPSCTHRGWSVRGSSH